MQSFLLIQSIFLRCIIAYTTPKSWHFKCFFKKGPFNKCGTGGIEHKSLQMILAFSKQCIRCTSFKMCKRPINDVFSYQPFCFGAIKYTTSMAAIIIISLSFDANFFAQQLIFLKLHYIAHKKVGISNAFSKRGLQQVWNWKEKEYRFSKITCTYAVCTTQLSQIL